MKILILGAGALGMVYGTYLSRENEVTLCVRRKEQEELINREGVFLEGEGVSENVKLKAVRDVTGLGTQDLVVILVKGYDTISALKKVLPVIGENTIVLTLQNGMGNYDNVSSVVDGKQIIIGTSGQGAIMVSDNVARHTGIGIDNIGCYDSFAEGEGKVKSIVNMFERCFAGTAYKAEYRENIDEYIWRKLFINIGTNSITAILEDTNSCVVDNPFGNKVSEAMVKEAAVIANACGQNFDVDEAWEYFMTTIKRVVKNRSSMYQDLMKGRPTEIDTINGAVVKRASNLGLEAPYNKMMTDLVKAKESLKKS